jgi:cyclase
VVGIDSRQEGSDYFVKQYTGDPNKTQSTRWQTVEWAREAQKRGAGEIVLNCMNQDGMRQGYDLTQLRLVRAVLSVPLVASGGAGAPEHFRDAFRQAGVDGALAASVFHKGTIKIPALKAQLIADGISIRP